MQVEHQATELERQTKLKDYFLEEGVADPFLDNLISLAADICKTPIAALSIVEKDRQWFKAKVGVELTETPLSQSFCAHTILNQNHLVIEDTTKDLRFKDNELVTGEHGVRFYAGAPVTMSDGFNLGAVCVIDTKTNRLTAEQIKNLERIAQVAAYIIETKNYAQKMTRLVDNVSELSDKIPICFNCKSVKSDEGRDWELLENFFSRQLNSSLTHSVCSKCSEDLTKSINTKKP